MNDAVSTEPGLASILLHAHQWGAQSGGVRKESLAPDQDSIGSMAAGEWICYDRIDFGPGRLTLFMACVAATLPGRKIEIRIDSPGGMLLGTLNVAVTGAEDLFAEQYAPIAGAAGIHDLYLVFPDGAVGLDWFVFSADPDDETPARRAERMRWWREARFGQFIHWGAYAVLARGEWVMYVERWSKTDYEAQAASRLDPARFDADEWVRMARMAGQKYLVITAKHHDGFCMYDTRIRGFDPIDHEDPSGLYDVVDFTPYGADPLLALSQACRRQGVRFCLYYSILDWHHRSQTPIDDGSGLTAMQPGLKARYISEMKAQLRELVERYDPAVLWFDGDWGGPGWWWTEADGAALYRYLRVLKPDLIVNERVKRDTGLGDFRSPEQTIPATGLPYDWETCMTMNASWGYHAGDDDWKPVQTLIQNLADIASKGGNFLLNVGPKADGAVPQQSVDRLAEIGAWMRRCGESIYGTTASPFAATPEWGRFTRKPGRLYALVFTWPADGRLRVPRLPNAISRIYLVDPPQVSLNFTLADGEVVIEVPDRAPNPYVAVVALDVAGTPARG